MLTSFWNRWISLESWWLWAEWNDGEDRTKEWQEALVRFIPDIGQHDPVCDTEDRVRRPPHVNQTEAWDCGIACLLMTLQWIQQNTSIDVAEERRRILQSVDTQSIWSIDLTCMLEEYKSHKRLQFTYLFCSQTLTVDHAHKDLSFYQTAFQSDQFRVTRLFERAREHNWNLLKMDLDVNQVLDLVRRPDCIAIALVDHAILLQRSPETQYAGHFIILSGVRTCCDGRLQVQVHNPTSIHDTDFISITLFEKAWTAKGTDKDIIFVMQQGPEK